MKTKANGLTNVFYSCHRNLFHPYLWPSAFPPTRAQQSVVFPYNGSLSFSSSKGESRSCLSPSRRAQILMRLSVSWTSQSRCCFPGSSPFSTPNVSPRYGYERHNLSSTDSGHCSPEKDLLDRLDGYDDRKFATTRGESLRPVLPLPPVAARR